MPDITKKAVEQLRKALQPLIAIQFDVLKIPRAVLSAFEPSQIGTIVGALMDACIPQLHLLVKGKGLEQVGLEKHAGAIGEREGYPDYTHASGKRVELKLLYVDPVGVQMKKPPRHPANPRPA
jgi:hypothetical protein